MMQVAGKHGNKETALFVYCSVGLVSLSIISTISKNVRYYLLFDSSAEHADSSSLFNPSLTLFLLSFWFWRGKKKRQHTVQVFLFLQPHAHRFNMCRNPKLNRPAVLSYGR